jgi:hypothetical protein
MIDMIRGEFLDFSDMYWVSVKNLDKALIVINSDIPNDVFDKFRKEFREHGVAILAHPGANAYAIEVD